MRMKCAAIALLLLPCVASATERVQIHFDVPSGLAGYSATQPVIQPDVEPSDASWDSSVSQNARV